MEVIGFSLDEFMAGTSMTSKKEARKTEGIKGIKTQQGLADKEKQTTVQQNKYAKDTLAKTADVNNVYLGFGNAVDEDDDVPAGRGGRGGARGGRGGRGGNTDRGGRGGARRQNPKQALKKTEDDFPTL